MGYGVDVPLQDCLIGELGPISLSQFFDVYGFFTVQVRLLVGAEYPVNFLVQVPEKLAPLLGAFLDYVNKVIQLDIYIDCG